MTPTAAPSQADLLRRVIRPDASDFSKEAAGAILALDFPPEDRERMDVLAAKAREGTLCPEEQMECKNYEIVGHLISLLQSKARQSLKSKP
jgi:hypothetical protein